MVGAYSAAGDTFCLKRREITAGTLLRGLPGTSGGQGTFCGQLPRKYSPTITAVLVLMPMPLVNRLKTLSLLATMRREMRARLSPVASE